MLDKIVGIIRRINYFWAVVVTLIGLGILTTEGWSWYKQPRLVSWEVAPSQEYKNWLDKNQHKKGTRDYDIVRRAWEGSSREEQGGHTRIRLRSQYEQVSVMYEGNLELLSVTDQDREIRDIVQQIWPQEQHNWQMIWMLVLIPLPLALILHLVCRWIFWGVVRSKIF